MARIVSTLGQIQGSMDNLTFNVSKGRNIIKRKIVARFKAGPELARSAAQIRLENAYIVYHKFINMLYFGLTTIRGNMSVLAKFNQLNNTKISQETPLETSEFSTMLMSKGNRQNLGNVSFDIPEDGLGTLSWESFPASRICSPNDTVNVYVYSSANTEIAQTPETALRSNGGMDLDLTAFNFTPNEPVHVFIIVKSVDGKTFADSIYSNMPYPTF